jgi:putative peptidoglycan lipid II flippase
VSSVGINVALNLTLVRVMGYQGLALGTSMAALVNAALQVGFLRRELGGLEGRALATSIARVSLIGVATAAAAWSVDRLLVGLIPGQALPAQALRLTCSLGAGLAAFVATAALLRVPEFAEAVARLRQRFKGAPGE